MPTFYAELETRKYYKILVKGKNIADAEKQIQKAITYNNNQLKNIETSDESKCALFLLEPVDRKLDYSDVQPLEEIIKCTS